MFRISRLVSPVIRSDCHQINRSISSLTSTYQTHRSTLSKPSTNSVSSHLDGQLLINQPAINSSSSKLIRSHGSQLSNHLRFSIPFIRDDTPRLPPIMWIYPKMDHSSDSDRQASLSASLNDNLTRINNDDQSNNHVGSNSSNSTFQFRQPTDQSDKKPAGQDEGQSTPDPDGGFSLDADLARVSLLAFAEFEAKQRAKKLQAEKIVNQTAINLQTLSVDPTNNSANQVSPDKSFSQPFNQSTNQIVDNDPIAASMDAFVALERALALKKLKAKQEYLDDPTAKSHVSGDKSNIKSTNQSNSHSVDQPLKRLEPPRMPEPYECCGMSCPNCVWITYAQEMQDYEEQKANSST